VPQPDLTCQQEAVVRAEGSLFVEACPGAGKTRAMVARFLKRTDDEPRKGIALISFTNAAIDEVQRRCADRPETLTVPNFVGTFDSFINRFITRPLYVRDYCTTPRFVDSWATLGIGEFRLTNMGQFPPLDLDWFELEAGLSRAVLRPGSGWGRYQADFDNLVASRGQGMALKAAAICRGLVANGTVSCEASRALAAGYLSSPATHNRIGRLLAARFAEVIVDETQDCGPEELLVLGLLREFGVQIVAVADLDQSIFEFRRADPEAVQAFAATFENRLTLDGNFRSSPAICALNSSLRHGPGIDQVVGQHADLTTKVQLLAFRQAGSIAERIEGLAATFSLTPQEIIFVAHKWSDARRYAGVTDTSVTRPNRVLSIAKAHGVLTTPSSGGRERLRAAEAAERIIRFSAREPGGPDKGVGPEVLDDRWLREAAIRLAISLDPVGKTPAAYAAAVREQVLGLSADTTHGDRAMDNRADPRRSSL
jgi:DNA helicase II / ATP-dependent DNA helicase PcrA